MSDEKCSCWKHYVPSNAYTGDYYYCAGTKEQERCSCGGDEKQCDFYPEKRKCEFYIPNDACNPECGINAIYCTCDNDTLKCDQQKLRREWVKAVRFIEKKVPIFAEKHTNETLPDEVTWVNGYLFDDLVNEIRNKSIETLKSRNDNYGNEDPLHNFHLGAAITGKTPAQTALGYMAKHLSSLVDKVNKDNFSDLDDLLEKCQDIINYTTFIWVLGNEWSLKHKEVKK